MIRSLRSCVNTHAFAAIAIATCLFFAHRCCADEALVKRGIVSQLPAKGRSVRVDDGHMVPYVEKIPGTDVTFEMIPVPGGEYLMGSPPGEANRSKDEGPQV